MRELLTSGRFLGRTLGRKTVGDLVLADVRYRAGSRLARHAHERPYFCLIRHGGYTETYGHRTRDCGPGLLAFHPPGESHAESFGDRSVSSFNVEIGPEWMYRMREAGGAPDQPVECRCGEAVRLGFCLFAEFRRSGPASTVAIESLTAEILSAFVARPANADQSKPKWLIGARDILDARLTEPPSLGSIAKTAAVHPVHFAATFRRFYGCSVGEYLRRVRFERLSALLKQPDLPLAEVALAAGFADQSHFTRAVRRSTGMTPTQYRSFLLFKTPTV